MLRWLTAYLFALASALNPALGALTVNQLHGFNSVPAVVASGGVIEFVGGALDRQAPATSGSTTVPLNSGLTGGIASGVSAGDLVIVAFSTGSTANRSLSITDGTTSYTLLGSELYSDDSFDTNLRVAYKFMGGTPDTTVSIGPTGSLNDAGIAGVYVFRGVDSSTPLDVAVTTATGTNTVLANPPSITPITAGAYVVAVGAGAHNLGLTPSYTSSDLTDFRETSASNTNDSIIGIGHKPDWASGAFNPAAFGFDDSDSTSFSWAALSIVLRPAP